MKIVPFAAIGAAALAVGCAKGLVAYGPNEKVTLRLRPEKGKRYRYETTRENSQNMGGMHLTVSETMDTTYEVQFSGGSRVGVHMTIDDLKIDSGAALLGSDSASLKDQVRDMAFDLTFDDHGHTLSSEKSGDSGGMIAKMIASDVADSSMGLLGIEYPDGEIGTGSTWTANVDVSRSLDSMLQSSNPPRSAVPATFKVEGIYAKAGHKLAIIDCAIKGTAQVSFLGSQMPIDVDRSGKITVDCTDGIPVEVEMTDKSGMSAGSVSSSQSSKSHMKLLD